MWPNSLTTTRALKSVYSLSKKNEAIDALINYTQDVVIPSGHRLQRLRSDRGGEYTGLEYREYCLRTGIKKEFASTDTPQQNGLSEREWASLWNMTRCFLAEAGVPNYLAGGLPHGSLPNKLCLVHPAGR